MQRASRREDGSRGHGRDGDFHDEEERDRDKRDEDEHDEGASASGRRAAGASAGREAKYCHRRGRQRQQRTNVTRAVWLQYMYSMQC